MVILGRPRPLAGMLICSGLALLALDVAVARMTGAWDASRLWPVLAIGIAGALLLRRPTAERASLSARVGDLTTAALDLHLRGAHLDLRSADLGDVLFDYSGHRAAVSVDPATGRVRARQARSWIEAAHPPSVDMVLGSHVAWTLRVRAAAMSGRLDLRRLRLRGLDLSATGTRFRADLPAPIDAVLVRIGRRDVHATLSVPEGTTVRFWQEHGWRVEGHRSSGPVPLDRYDVWLEGRAGCCRVETRPAETPPPLPRPHVVS
jgi:hypothetical protein